MITALLFAALLQAAGGAPQPAPAPDPAAQQTDQSTPVQPQAQTGAPAQTPAQPAQRRICHMEAPIGSIIQHRVCRTLSTQTNDRDEAERALNYLQNDGAQNCPTGPGSCM